MSCHSSHVGVAATHYAAAVTDLDAAQVASIFHRLKNIHKDAPTPSIEDATNMLGRLKREVLADSRLPDRTKERLANRYDKALVEVEQGIVPDGRTWVAMQWTPIEAEIAEQHLDYAINQAARAQRKNPERMAAIFRNWRRSDHYEDMESPDPAYRLDPEVYPADKRTQRAVRKMGLENYLSVRKPVFVYGTLRRGEGNDRLMDGAIVARSEEAHVEGIAVYGASWGFPYANETSDPTSLTRGDLVHLSNDTDGDWARERLDTLEGFNSDQFSDSHYRRVARTVTYTTDTGNTEQVEAWVYLAGNASQERCTEDELIEHGDWVQASREDNATYRSTSRKWWDALPEGDEHSPSSAEESAAVFFDNYDNYVVTKSAVT